MATISLIERLAHSPMSEHLAALQAQLKLDEPLDFALSTSSGSLLSSVMRLLRFCHVSVETEWYREQQWISSSDFKSLRSSLLSRLHSFVPGPQSDVSKTLHLLLGQWGVLNSNMQPLIDDVIAALLAKGADPLAPDAKGDNTLFHLARSGDYVQLIKLLHAAAPWQACGVESGGGKGASASQADMSRMLHLLLGQQTGAQPLLDDVIAALLAKGVDPQTTDAEGNNALLLLAKSNNHAQLIRLLSGSAPWKPCGLETAVFHHNAAGQSARSLMETRHPPATRTPDVLVVLVLIQAIERFWTRNIKPKLIHTLTHDCGMAKDVANLCAQYIDGSGGIRSN